MTNEEAIELLTELTDQASRAVSAGTWALAFLSYGGEATWDAVKDISRIAADIATTASEVAHFEDIFEEIIP